MEADDEIVVVRHSIKDNADDDRPRLRSASQRNLSMSVASVDGGAGELFENHANEHKVMSNEVPWKLIFTHPVTLTLFFQAWCYVSNCLLGACII